MGDADSEDEDGPDPYLNKDDAGIDDELANLFKDGLDIECANRCIIVTAPFYLQHPRQLPPDEGHVLYRNFLSKMSILLQDFVK